MSDDIRRAAVAGSWYPASRARLAQEVDEHVAAAFVDESFSCPRAIIAPHAGLMYSGPVAAYVYKLATRCRTSAVVLVGPSHFVGFEGVSVWPKGAWETPFGPLHVAESLAKSIQAASPAVVVHPSAHGREHSLEMQLPFVGRLLPGVKIVPLVMGYQNRGTAFALAGALVHAVESHGDDRDGVLLVASSDLSHFEDAPTAARMDAVVMRRVEALDPEGLMDDLEREPRHACGGGPMVSVMKAATLLGATKAQVLRYGDSGDVSGDKSSVVGYMAAAIW
jgi:AmmeMemoRadiSam system protein B